MIVLGIKCFSHDTGAAILADDGGELRLHAVSEARLNRRKHSFAYPLMSVAYCLDALGLRNLGDVDAICIDRHMEIWPEADSQFGYARALRRHHPRYDDVFRWSYLIEQTMRWPAGKVHWINHIDAHAASAFFVSPFERAAVLVAEGGTGIYEGADSALRPIDRIGYKAPSYHDGAKTAPGRDAFVNSSFLYDRVSEILGYDIFGAGQTMALAGFADRFSRVDQFDVDPGRFDDFIVNHDKTVFGLRGVAAFDGDDTSIVAERWVNFARQAQETLETDLLHLARLAKRKTGADRLCLAGGAALNCIINRGIMDSGLFEELFIQPAASDEGIPLGCALYGYHALGGRARTEMTHTYLGVPNDPTTLDASLAAWGVTARPADAGEVAALLAAGKITGRVAGGSEYGPRALGNRSILADPRPAGMKDRLNRDIKHREGFRPFAPSCLEDRPPGFFDSPARSPFMIVAGRVIGDAVPAVTHADGSCRVQTVNRGQNSDYYALIEAFGDATGCPVLLNTSFNDRDEPIVETYDDAISCFLRTGLDALVLDGHLVERGPGTPSLDREDHAARTVERVDRAYADLIERFCDMEAYVALAGRLNDEEGSMPGD
jgi:carbamoyltransferase